MPSLSIIDRIVAKSNSIRHKKSYSANDAALSIPKTYSYTKCTCRGSQYCPQCADMASPIIPTSGFMDEVFGHNSSNSNTSTTATDPFDGYPHPPYHSSSSSTSSASSFSSATTPSPLRRQGAEGGYANQSGCDNQVRTADISLWAARRGNRASYDGAKHFSQRQGPQ